MQDPLKGSEAGAPGTLALYVHWPFCASKCPYCDFNSHIRDGVDQDRYARAFEAEIARIATIAPGRVLTSIFFGGGTPSLMAVETAARVIEAAARAWAFSDTIEITLEANPTSVEANKFAGFRTVGVNRASLGVQALDDQALDFLGRTHSQGEALAAVALAHSVFPRISFDLIYGRPGQTVTAWEGELRQALHHAPDHLSAYQLTIEEGTAFHAAVRRGDWALPDDETQAAFYEATQAVLEAEGLPAYEISNHARPGAEARHNLTYWRYGDYAGIGPGAHGRLTTVGGEALATRAFRKPETWVEAVETTGDGSEATHPLDPRTRATEALMMGLRLAEGVPYRRLEHLTAHAADTVINQAQVQRLTEHGFLAPHPNRLITTPKGRAVLDSVLAGLLI